MKEFEKYISPFIVEQLPVFYREEGPLFIEFIKTYYEWLEDTGNLNYDARRLLEYGDIDKTTDEFINSFIEKYMSLIPNNFDGDVRLLQKHIKELNSSKGTPRGLRLLFRLLFNESINVYYPGNDILRTSDGKWQQPIYLEVEDIETNALLIGETITGGSSGATAIVETFEQRVVNNRIINILNLSNVRGTFKTNEPVLADVISVENSPKIIGSFSRFEVEGGAGGLNFAKGDVLTVDGGFGIDGSVIVTQTGQRSGVISFSIDDGGNGYTPNAEVIITGDQDTGAVNASADIAIDTSNTSTIVVSTDAVQFNEDNVFGDTFGNVAMDSADYGFEVGTAYNANSTFDDAFTYEAVTVAPVDRFININPGSGYTGNISITIIDPLISGYYFQNDDGTYKGRNAEATGTAISGSGVIEEVIVKNSGFGYLDNENVSLVSNNSSEAISGTIKVEQQGSSDGFWKNTDGFISSDKYLQDSFYYQEFSFEIQAKQAFEKYAELVKNVWKPAGTEMFGKALIIDNETFDSKETSLTITQA